MIFSILYGLDNERRIFVGVGRQRIGNPCSICRNGLLALCLDCTGRENRDRGLVLAWVQWCLVRKKPLHGLC